MKFSLTLTLWALLALCFFYACASSSKVASSKDFNAFDEAEYLKLGSNLERLQQLKSGTFVQYREYWQHDTIVPWKVNEGRDSMVLYIAPVGVPNRDGYWIYYHQFLSNLSDAPVYTAYEKLEMLSRDTFKGTFYEAPTKFEWKKVLAADKSVVQADFVNLKATGEEVFYVRKDAHSFDGFSVIYKNVVKSTQPYRQDLYSYRPNEFVIDIYFYDDANGTNKARSGVVEHLLRRVPTSLPMMNP